MLTSLFSLFYVTCEFHRFLHRRRAENCCFDRKRLLNGLNRLNLHVINERCFCIIMIASHMFSCILLISNHMIFLMQFGINKHL